MPAPRKRMADSDDAFFAALERGDTVKAAATVTGCSRQALYQRRITDRAFDQRWHAVESARLKRRRLQTKRRKAPVPVFEPRGRGKARKPLSDGLLLARLKALRPGAYRESAKDAAKEREGLRLFRRIIREGTVSRAALSSSIQRRPEQSGFSAAV
ncbi:MAG: hypothetical protein KBA31_09995 [Alphaproteobacteria bacterium]|nr:hypothetical protein [Alphaproteobacteria bacterium]